MSNESFSDQRSTDENTLRARSSSFISICLLLFLSPSSFAASKRQNTKTRCASAPRFRDRGIRKLAAWRDFPPRAILPSPYHSTSPSPPLPLSPRPPSAFRPGTGSTAALFRRRARSSPSPSPSPPPPLPSPPRIPPAARGGRNRVRNPARRGTTQWTQFVSEARPAARIRPAVFR